jgi:sugar lactone lactonase YvrE
MKIISLSLISLFTSGCLNAQIISTIGGTGIIGNTGDGGLATLANISYPGAGIFDKHGNYYFVTSSTGNSVRKITPDGYIYTIAGTGDAGFSGDNGPATAAKLKTTQDIAIDSLGNIYIADAGNNRIRKVSATDGIITTVAGNGSTAYSGDGGAATAAGILSPLAICFDNLGNLYIGEHGSARVRKVNTSGIINTAVGTATHYNSAGGGLADTTPIVGASGLCTDAAGNLYVANWHSRVYKVNSSGIITTIVGTGETGYNGDGGLALNAKTVPLKIVVGKSGNLFIAEYDHNRIRMVNTAGVITTIVGNGVAGFSGDGSNATDAQIYFPGGVALDSCDNLYITDTRNHRIRKIAFNPDCVPTSVKDVSTNHDVFVKLYPNPTNSNVTVEGKGIRSIAVWNVVGQVVSEQEYKKTDKVTVDVSNLPSGVYMVRVNDVWVGKVVKE